MIKLIVLILELIADILLCLTSVYGNISPEVNVGSTAVVMLVTFGLYSVITIGAMIRLRKGRKAVILPELGMKIWTLFMGAGVLGNLLEGEVAAGIGVSVILGVVLLPAVIIAISNKREKRQNQSSPNNGLPAYHLFEGDKAKYQWDSAAEEYSKLRGISIDSFSEEDSDKVYEYAALPMGYFMQWIMDNKLYSESFAQDLQRTPDASGPDMIAIHDYTMSMDDLDPRIHGFLASYYEREYFSDYYLGVQEEGPEFYCHEFSLDTYQKIAKRIDRAYDYYLREDVPDIDDEHLREELHVEAFGQSLEIYAADDVTDAYYQRVVDYLKNFPKEVLEEMRHGLNSMAFNGGLLQELEAYTEPTDVFKNKCRSGSVIIYKPFSEDVAFMIGFETDIEVEHGIGFTIRENAVLDWGYNICEESPWSKGMEMLYQSILQIRDNKLIEIDGVKLPEIIVSQMKEADIMMSLKVRQGQIERFEHAYEFAGEKEESQFGAIPKKVMYKAYKKDGSRAYGVGPELAVW